MHKALKNSMVVLENINTEIGIDMTKYQNTEIMGKITSLLMIQKYTFSSLVKPTAVSFFAFVAGFFILNLEIFGLIIYTLFGSILFFLMGIFYGILKLLAKLKNDLRVITDFALDTTTNIVADINHVNIHMKDNVKNPLGLILEGTIAAIISPAVCTALGKIPIAGNMLISGSHKILDIVVSNFKIQENKINFSKLLGDSTSLVAEKANVVDDFFISFSATVEKTINKGFRYIHSPVKYAFIGTTVCTICLVSLIYIF